MDITIDGFHSWMWKVTIIVITFVTIVINIVIFSSLLMTLSHYGIPILFMDVELDDHSHIFHVSKVMICTISMMISNALQLNHLFITMIQGLVWLLPFLYFGYLFEIYNAYALYFIYLQVRFE